MTVNKGDILAGVFAGVLNKDMKMRPEEAQVLIQKMMESIKGKAAEKKYADNKAAGEKFLAENKTKEGVKTTASGLQYKVITEGKGEIPNDTCKEMCIRDRVISARWFCLKGVGTTTKKASACSGFETARRLPVRTTSFTI